MSSRAIAPALLLGLLAGAPFAQPSFAPPSLAQPSFDCAEARGTVQELICADEEFAALDRELDEVWKKALPRLPEADQKTERAMQRGWIKGRDECWKSSEVATCVHDEYERRITALQIKAGLLEVPSPVAFDCEGTPADASFVIATQPRAGAHVSSPFEVMGCSRTFESTVTWRLLARDGSLAAEGITQGGGVDGPGPFHFTVEAEGTGLHHLVVDEPRITDEGFPPGRTVLPLVLDPR
jgi:uncharacterized protein